MSFLQFKNTRLIDLLFFLLFFLYVWFWINPVLIHQQQQPVFFNDYDFFIDFLAYPGGLVDYLSSFFGQFYILSWLGALIITLITWLTCSITNNIINLINDNHDIPVISLIPSFFFLIFLNQYNNPLSVILGFLISLIGFNLFIFIKPHHTSLRIFLYFLLSLFLYYLTSGSYLIFLVLCVINELLFMISSSRIKIIFFVFTLTIIFILPYITANYISLISLKDAYFYLLPIDIKYIPTITPYLLYLFIPFIMLVVLIQKRYLVYPKLIKNIKYLSKLFEMKLFSEIHYRLVWHFIIIFMFASGAAFISFDNDNKALIQMEHFTLQRQWQKILEIANHQPLNHVLFNWYINRALYQEGFLLSDMFSYPQSYGVDGLFITPKLGSITPQVLSDFYLELGHVNQAQHWAHEALSLKGETPWNLQRLAIINILKGETQAAQMFLNMLNNTFLYCKWSESYQQYLNDDSLLPNANKIEMVRSLMAHSDFLVSSDKPQADLIFLLNNNNHNKMAFEYLMAYYLLNRSLGDIVENIKHLKEFDYPNIPRHYEEALVLISNMTRRYDQNLSDLFIDPNTKNRFQHFISILNRYKDNKLAAQRATKESHGDTYWYYFTFHEPISMNE